LPQNVVDPSVIRSKYFAADGHKSNAGERRVGGQGHFGAVAFRSPPIKCLVLVIQHEYTCFKWPQ
jgi:hypothetical protein